MDIDLGKGIDGTEAARQILALRNIPIVFLTSHSEKEYVDKVKEITRYGYVIKNSGNFVLQTSIDMAFELSDAHHRMHENETRLQTLFKTIPDLIWLKDVHGVYLSCNGMFERFVGASEANIVGKTDYDLVEKNLADFFLENDRKAMANEKPTTNEEWITFADTGSKVLLETIKTPMINNAGQITGVLGIGRDISEHKRIENKLMESQALYHSLVDQLPAGVFRKDAEGRYVFVSPWFCRLKNMSAEEFLGKTPQEIAAGVAIKQGAEGFAVKYAAAGADHHTLIMQNSKPIEIEEEYTGSSGMKMYVSVKKIPVFDPDGNVIGSQGIMFDITERKQTEEALRIKNEELATANEEFEAMNEELVSSSLDLQNLNDELLASEEKFKNIFEYSPVGISITSVTGVLKTNKAFCKILGYDENELSNLNWKDISYPEDIEHNQNILDSILAGEKISDQWQKRYIHKNGNIIWAEIYTALLRDRNNVPLYFISTIVDITERKHAEEKIKALLEEKELFIKEVHHRIKNNMSTVVGLLSLQAGALKDPSAIEALMVARSRVQSMMLLYDKLYRSSDFNKMSLKEYISPLIDEILGNFPNMNSVTIEKQIDDFILEARIFFPIGIIVNELITNAMKYSFKGRDRGLIRISALCNNNHVIITVEDNGIGLPESIDINNSTGFGLKLVDMLAHQIGGKITIERRNGTKFILEFTI
jgi:PAS domain S-box-containing protein